MPPVPAADSTPSATASGSAFISARDVTKTYQRGSTAVHALKAVSLTISRGQFVGIEGPSGSGKSTLLHLLAALDESSNGTLQVGNWALGALDSPGRTRYRRSMVGLVFQQFHLVPTMTARENVALPLLLVGVPPAERTRRADTTLTQVGLADRRDHRPAELSGGEQQRVATARALVGNPPLLLADEPTGNLDAETGGQIIDLLARLHREQNRTVVVATHHVDEITAHADRLLHLRDGARVGPA
jgi:putative ABC transport system ATP-binding protein